MTYVNIGSDNALSHVWCLTIDQSNGSLLSIGSSWPNLNKHLIIKTRQIQAREFWGVIQVIAPHQTGAGCELDPWRRYASSDRAVGIPLRHSD